MGFIGKILVVDLSTQHSSSEALPLAVYRKYLSGIGLAAYYLTKEIPPSCDPLGPDNILGFVSGIATGTGAPFSGRWLVACKSPLTGTWGDANCGGDFSPAIKRCGFDAIFFKGRSPHPIYLWIQDGSVRFESADDLWGIDAVETEEILIARHTVRRKPSVACIGEAGEKLSLISGICHDKGRIAARSGVGAVMGSKLLKAVVLSGSKPIPVKFPDIVKENAYRLCKTMKMQKYYAFPDFTLSLFGKIDAKSKNNALMDGMMTASVMKKWGTSGSTNLSLENGDAPVKNWAGSVKDFGSVRSMKLSPEKLARKENRKYHCYACPMGCGGICSYEDDNKTYQTHKPEYETVNSFGALLLNDDLDSIFIVNETLNRAGMDTISAAGVIAFAMECYENGTLSNENLDGIDLKWGNSKAIIALCDKMIHREGIGELLADGVKAAVKRIGRKAQAAAIHAGGQELPAHDGRHDPGYAVHYSAEPTPGRHTIGSFQYYGSYQLWSVIASLPKIEKKELKQEMFIPSETNTKKLAACSDYKMVIDSGGFCLFGKTRRLQRLQNGHRFGWFLFIRCASRYLVYQRVCLPGSCDRTWIYP